MPDYDPKTIPVLDDIIEDEINETATVHEKITISDEMHADDNTLDMFNGSTAEIQIDVDGAEPEIGTIDQFNDPVTDEDVDIEIEAGETQDKAIQEGEAPDEGMPNDDSAVFESAIISYPLEDDVEQRLEQGSENDASPETINADEEQNKLPENIDETAVIAEPATNLDLDLIIDDVVTRMMPELEQQLRARLRQALQEQAYKQKNFMSTDERK
jgi:hypothetical protein